MNSLIIKQNGSVWGVGKKQFGQVRAGFDTQFLTEFVKIFDSGVKAVAAGMGGHSIVLKQDGSVWTAGKNKYGQLGDGLDIDRSTFATVIPNGAKAVAAGSKHSLVVKEDGNVMVTGCNMYGQLGESSVSATKDFLMVSYLSKVLATGAAAVSAGVDHSMVLGQDGSVWTAGANYFGQLGDGSTISKHSFVQVLSTDGKAVAAGGYHSVVLKKDGTVWTMGDNKHGQLGDGSVTLKHSVHPISVSTGSSAKAIAAGLFHTMIMHEDGSVYAAGANHRGQLGDDLLARSDKEQDRSFVSVITSGVKAVAAGHFHSMILKRDGSFWSAGASSAGQLGDGSRIAKNVFVRAAQGSNHGVCWVQRVCSMDRVVLVFARARVV